MKIINNKFKVLMDDYINEYYKVERNKKGVIGLKKKYFKLINEKGFENEVRKCEVLCELNDNNRIKLSKDEWGYVGSFIGVEWSEYGFDEMVEKDLGL